MDYYTFRKYARPLILAGAILGIILGTLEFAAFMSSPKWENETYLRWTAGYVPPPPIDVGTRPPTEEALEEQCRTDRIREKATEESEAWLTVQRAAQAEADERYAKYFASLPQAKQQPKERPLFIWDLRPGESLGQFTRRVQRYWSRYWDRWFEREDIRRIEREWRATEAKRETTTAESEAERMRKIDAELGWMMRRRCMSNCEYGDPPPLNTHDKY